MSFVKRIAGAAFGAALMFGSGLIASPAQAGYVVILEEMGKNVVATGDGSLDLTFLFPLNNLLVGSLINPANAEIDTGTAGFASLYLGVPGATFFGPTNFGGGSFTLADSGSGDIVGINGSSSLLAVPVSYSSGNPLSGSAIYIKQTLSTLGVTPGTYIWTWGIGAQTDSFTLNIVTPAAIPEPASIALLGAALAGLGLAGTVLRKRN